MNDTLILGGGPAGLAAGFYLTRAGVRVSVIEGSPEVGGFARTFTHGPFKYDAGAHRFHDKDSDITRDVQDLLGDELLQVHAPSQICWKGRFLDFPLSPANLARHAGAVMLLRSAADLFRARMLTRERESLSFADVAIRRFGKAIAEAFLLGYSEKLWGVSPENLMPEVSGGRLKGLGARTMLYELLRGKQKKTEHLDGSFYYPRQGYGTITTRLAEAIGAGNIRTSCRIGKIVHDGGRITSVVLDDASQLTPERVISSLAPAQMLVLLDPPPPEKLLESARSLKFRDLLLVVLILDRPRVTRNASIYFPARDVPFTRLYEPKNRSVEMAPPRQTCVVAEIPCFADDERWRESDAELQALVKQHLVRTSLLTKRDVIDGRVHRLNNAYPVLELGTEHRMGEIRNYLERFTNLYAIGRAGRFEYTHVHDLMRQGKELAKLLSVEITSQSERTREVELRSA